MLSGETAVDQYPVESVEMIMRIANEIEKAVKSNIEDTSFINISDTMSRAIQRISQSMPIHKVITLTQSGYTAGMIARFKITQPIIAVTLKVKKQLELIFGVYPLLINYREEKDRLLTVTNKLCEMHLVDDEETVLFTESIGTSMEHVSNSIEIHNLKELSEFAASSKDI